MKTNYDWYIETDLSIYAGKWVAIINNQVVASGDKVKEVFNLAKQKYPNKIPTITRIAKEAIHIL